MRKSRLFFFLVLTLIIISPFIPYSSGKERPERPDRPERPEKPGQPDRPERPDRPEQPDRPDRAQANAIPEYGEDSASLGQFVDEYTDTGNVSVAVNVARNSTLNAMELSYSELVNETMVFAPLQLKEHKHYAAFTPGVTWTVHASQIRMTSSIGGLGGAKYFFVVNRAWIDGLYLRWRWGHGWYSSATTMIYDGSYDRSSGVDFPSGAAMLLKGNGLLQTLDTCGLTVKTSDVLIDVSGGSEDNVTIFILHNDAWGSQSLYTDLYWLQINEGSGGADNILQWTTNNGGSLTMEQTGTANDYGRYTGNGVADYEVLVGGYASEGYFTTTELLSGVNGSSIVLMTNTTIPSGSITVEFSDDNSTWTLNDWEPITGGYESIDLRVINDAQMYLRYNFTRGGVNETPRLFQSRIITTEGERGPGLNVSGEWVYFNASEIGVTTGTYTSGDLNSTFFVDGDQYNVSEVIGEPGYLISVNWTGVDTDAISLWILSYHYYSGNVLHHIHMDLWNHSSASWVDHIVEFDDDVAFEWHNGTVYSLRIPDGEIFVNENGEVFGRYHMVPLGVPAHWISIDFVKLQAFIPSDVIPSVAGDVDIGPWIAIAIILSIVAFLLARSR